MGAVARTRTGSPGRKPQRRAFAWLVGSREESSPPRREPAPARRQHSRRSEHSRSQERLVCHGLCRRARAGAHRYRRRSAESTLEIPEELGFVSQLVVSRLEETRRWRAPSSVVSRRHHAQPPANELRGRDTCRAGSLQSPYVLLFETDRRRDQACHTFTIQRPTREGNRDPTQASGATISDAFPAGKPDSALPFDRPESRPAGRPTAPVGSLRQRDDATGRP